MMSNLPFYVEYANSGRSKCRRCRNIIPRDSLRFASIQQSFCHDGPMNAWYHSKCFFLSHRPKTVGDFAHFDCIRWDDQNFIKEQIAINAPEGVVDSENSTEEESKSQKRKLNSNINDFWVEKPKSDETKCNACDEIIINGDVRISKKYYETEENKRLNGIDIWHHVACFVKIRKDLEFYDSGASLNGFKILSAEDQEMVKISIPKLEGSDIPDVKKTKIKDDAKLEEKKEQNEKMFEIRDELIKYKKRILTRLLNENKQFIPKGISRILDMLADVMTFGALETCNKCRGKFEFQSEFGYKCMGDVNEWVKCVEVDMNPVRRKFVIPEDLMDYDEFFSLYKSEVRERIFKITAPSVSRANKENEIDGPEVNTEPKSWEDMNFLEKLNHLMNDKSNSGVTKFRIKGGGIVDPDSNLKDIAHVYQHDEEKYNVILVNVDIQSRKNSFYRMQILKHDYRDRFWLHRNWGRIGTDYGGTKTDPMPLEECIKKFEKLYEEKSGNDWDERDLSFEKKPGKMYPIHVEYSDDEDYFESKLPSNLEKPVQDVIKLIFDRNIIKCLLKEFEIDTDKMPLGKLSRNQMEDAFHALTDLLHMVQSKTASKVKLIEASNKFYTLIPHDFGGNSPKIISTEEEIKAKSDMVLSLMDMKIVYNFLHNETYSTINPIDLHYQKLNVEINVLDKENEMFEIIKQYIKNTHAEIHRQYELEIEEIYAIKRLGEESRCEPFKNLHNRKLLWHGSHTTNFAGILSQGLRIAPPEAPLTGDMFGKGIYFADVVSKSANYCKTNLRNPTGLLLLCEVALGDMYECYQSQNIKNLPQGKHSTFALGRTHPDPSIVHKTSDGVEIPYGPLIQAQLPEQPRLLHNEYIVYDVAQVKFRYLIKMNFKYK